MSCTAGELAKFLGATIVGDSQTPLSGMAMPENARAEDLIYIDSPRHLQRAEDSAAKCVLAPPGLQLKGKTILTAENPKFAFAKAAALLLPKFAPPPGVHATAIVASSARLGPNVFIGPYVVIEDEVEVGEGSIVEAFCFLGRGSAIGEKCRLHPRVTLYANSRLAKGVELHSGVVIGGDGFGYVFGEGRHWKFPQIGTVEIGDNVEIGCNTTIDRGSLGVTQHFRRREDRQLSSSSSQRFHRRTLDLGIADRNIGKLFVGSRCNPRRPSWPWGPLQPRRRGNCRRPGRRAPGKDDSARSDCVGNSRASPRSIQETTCGIGALAGINRTCRKARTRKTVA